MTDTTTHDALDRTAFAAALAVRGCGCASPGPSRSGTLGPAATTPADPTLPRSLALELPGSRTAATLPRSLGAEEVAIAREV